VIFGYSQFDGFTITPLACVMAFTNGTLLSECGLEYYLSFGAEVPVFNTSNLSPEARFATGFNSLIIMDFEIECKLSNFLPRHTSSD
jgi:hypothetical protein